MALVFAFFCFLFFRILSSAMFDHPMTIWACALTAIVITPPAIFGAILGFDWSMKSPVRGPNAPDTLKYAFVVVAVCAVSCLAAYLITLGFSQSLYKEISHWSRFKDPIEQDAVWFFVMITIPLVVQMTLYYWQATKQL